MTRGRALGLAFLFEGALLLLAFALGWVTGHAPFGLLRLSPSGLAAGVAAGLLMLGLLGLAARTGWPPFARLEAIVREFVALVFARATLLDLAIVSALAGIAEEALFRGAVQAALVGVVGPLPAVGVAAALFGLAHYVTFAYAVAATAIGILLGALLLTTDDLAAPIVAHALYDFLALTWLARGVRSPSAEAGPAS